MLWAVCKNFMSKRTIERTHVLGSARQLLNFLPATDVAVADGVILAVGPGLREQYAARTTHDARGQLVTPGLVDAHGHFYRHCTPLGGPPL